MERQQALVSVRLLARVGRRQDPSTRRHSERVGDLCAEIAEALGWTPERASLLREAGLVHDVGKIGVSDAILFKPGPLTPAEYELVKEHAAARARGSCREALTAEQVSWVRSHHERWDGNGYPDGLTAEECPEGARIMALADAWDVMTSDRIYTSVPASRRRTPSPSAARTRAPSSGRPRSRRWRPSWPARERSRRPAPDDRGDRDRRRGDDRAARADGRAGGRRRPAGRRRHPGRRRSPRDHDARRAVGRRSTSPARPSRPRRAAARPVGCWRPPTRRCRPRRRAAPRRLAARARATTHRPRGTPTVVPGRAARPARSRPPSRRHASARGRRRGAGRPPAPPPVVTTPGTPDIPPPPTDDTPIDGAPGGPPPVVEPPVEEPPVKEPPVKEPPVKEPPVKEPPVKEPPVKEPPVDEAPGKAPPTTAPADDDCPPKAPPAKGHCGPDQAPDRSPEGGTRGAHTLDLRPRNGIARDRKTAGASGVECTAYRVSSVRHGERRGSRSPPPSSRSTSSRRAPTRRPRGPRSTPLSGSASGCHCTPEDPAGPGRFDGLGQVVVDGAGGDAQAPARRVDRLVVVRGDPVQRLSPVAASAREPASTLTSCSLPSKRPIARRCSSWPRSSGRCWRSVPPAGHVDDLRAAADAEHRQPARRRPRARGRSRRRRAGGSARR